MAAGAEVASAFVTLIPSFKGGKKRIEKELSGVIVTGGKEGGKRGGVAAAAALGAGIRKVGLPIVAAAGAAMGLALSKGFGRLANIEDATAKLRGLGHSAQTVEKIMQNALASVKGTAFGLDEAATVAAGVVAAGIKPGKELEGVLKLVADAATIAGTSMGEMGAIFNKVAAGNRLSMEEVNQLSDRGVPIMQMLAKQYGVTAAEARKMVEKGQIDFAAFRQAMESNLAGAALESGNTTRGAFANVMAALSRFGATLLSGIFPHFKTFFSQLIVWIDGLTDKVGPFASELSKNLGGAFKEVLPLAQSFLRGLQGFTAKGSGPLVALSQAGNSVREAWKTAVPVLKSVADTVRANLLPGIAGIGKALIPVGQAVLGFFKEVAPAVGQLAGTVGKFIGSLLPIVQKFVQQVGTVLGPALKEIGSLIANEVAPALSELLAFIQPAVAWVLKFVGEALVGALRGAAQAVKGALNIIVGVLRLVMALFRGEWSTAWEAVKQIGSGIWNTIVGLFKVFINVGIGKAFKVGINLITKAATGLWNGLGNLFKKGIDAILGFVRKGLSNMGSAFTNGFLQAAYIVGKGIGNILNYYRKLPGQIVNALKSLAGNLKKVFSAALNGVVNVMRTAPSKIKGALGKVGSILLNSGKEIINGLIRGIRSKIGEVKNAVGDVMSAARRLLPFSPAKEGPFSGRGWTLFSGRSIVEGLADGIKQRESLLRKTVESALQTPQLGFAGAGVNITGGDTHVTVILDGEPIRSTVRTEIRRNNRDIYRAASSGIGGAR